MRVKSIALWVLAVILAAVLFYFFRDDMTHQDARQVGLDMISVSVSAVS